MFILLFQSAGVSGAYMGSLYLCFGIFMLLIQDKNMLNETSCWAVGKVSNILSTLSKRFLDFDLVNRSVRVILLVLYYNLK